MRKISEVLSFVAWELSPYATWYCKDLRTTGDEDLQVGCPPSPRIADLNCQGLAAARLVGVSPCRDQLKNITSFPKVQNLYEESAKEDAKIGHSSTMAGSPTAQRTWRGVVDFWGFN